MSRLVEGGAINIGVDRSQLSARNLSPIVPRGSIASRALAAVVAIMSFLAALTTGAVLLIAASAAEWQSDVSSEITIQVRPMPGRDLTADTNAAANALRGQAGIAEVRPYSRQESMKLLEPWLGTGLPLDELPVPQVIVARMAPGAALDLAALRARVSQAAPGGSIDDHRAWIERMRAMTGATVLAGLGILALVMLATVISVSFATRGAMAANRPVIEVLDFVGASDSYIANRFLRHFLVLALQGSLIGTSLAMLLFGFAEPVAGWFSGTAVGDQFVALLGTFALRPSGYVILAVQALAVAAVVVIASRRTLFATLHDLD
jgi:cell division transport system permease protein